jgi:hypothetical protein
VFDEPEIIQTAGGWPGSSTPFPAAGYKLYCSPVPVSSPPGKQSLNFTIVEVLWMPSSPDRLSPAKSHPYFN